jgi:HK97 gp10 family phage protein
MSGISIDADMRGLLNSLKNEVNKVTEEIDMEIGAHAELMATSAKNMAPVNKDTGKGGRLRSSISVKREQFLTYDLVVQANYAAYVEFGTGKYAANYVPSLDEEWQKLALTFKKSGMGRMPARPYLYPSVMAYMPSLINTIKKLVK